jgi:selenide,water dikinase
MTATTGDQLLLAGGGHSHALLLRMWAMQPQRRPAGLISLINRRSTALYSGMVPGLIAGIYAPQDVAIDLRTLADRAGVALIIAEITGIDCHKRLLLLQDRAPLPYDRLSLDVGAVSPAATSKGAGSNADLKAIKPLEPALAFLSQEDGVARSQRSEAPPFHVLGAGLAGVEVALALRQRWPERRLILQGRSGKPAAPFRRALAEARITGPGCRGGSRLAHAPKAAWAELHRQSRSGLARRLWSAR